MDLSEKVGSLKTSESDTAAPDPASDKALGFGQTIANKNASANAALDPNHPLHLTLPTFRMLVLADENLEGFFDSGFPNSFHLASAPLPSSIVTSTSNLSQLSAAGAQAGIPTHRAAVVGGPGAGVVAPGKGLRGMLDNIVTDGMRVAAEVRKRIDEAQTELDRSAVTRGVEEEEDDDEDEGGRDLLEGADAEAMVSSSTPGRATGPGLLDEAMNDGTGNSSTKGRDKGKGKEKATVSDPAKVTEPAEKVEEETVFER